MRTDKKHAFSLCRAGRCGITQLANGCPIHAETKSQKGFDAAVSLVNSQAGVFSFEPEATSPETTIEASVTELLLEASRVLDESLA